MSDGTTATPPPRGDHGPVESASPTATATPRATTAPGARRLARRPHRPDHPDLRRQLLIVTVAWGFGSYWLWTISGAAMTQFARGLGTPDYAFGILAALPFVGSLFQIPASYALERFGHRKLVFLLTGTIGRAMWTVAALIPWLLPGRHEWWWPAMLLTLLVSWAAANISVPAWMNWMSDLIPRRLRGRYFAVRNLVGQPIGLIVTLLVGYLLDQAGQVAEARPDLMLKVTSAILGIAGLVGMIDILAFRWVHDHEPPRPERPESLLHLMRGPLADRNFRHYLAFNFVFTLAIGFIGQYVWLYAFDEVGWTNQQANFLLIGVPLLVRMATYRLWGRLIDRLGKKPVMLITGFITVWGAVGWLIITPERFWVGYTLIVLTSAAWPGLEIASFNFVLDLAGSRRDESSGASSSAGSTAYVAVNSVAIAIGGILSGLFGSAVAEGFRDLRQPIPWLDITLTYHGVLFLVSTALRLAALVWAAALVEPEATGTRDAIRYMTVSLYSNVRQAVLMPTRVVGRVVRWTYRINGESQGERPLSATPPSRR